mmetsp:Transcript_89937/g.131644  ORF Transcript_89937/g.131644 Transcript_89937/m.131644 type:complete len:94 (+) Transcript_89937:143-424(+)
MLKLSYSASGHVDEVNGMGLLRDKAWATDLEAWATDLDLPAFAVSAEPDASADKQALDSGAASCTTPPERGGYEQATQIIRQITPVYFNFPPF